MTLKLYNSLTRQKEDFVPADPKRVTMYNCGPTVYSYAHIGNARAAVVADVLFRVLRHIYGDEHVVYARNITDVEDKIIAAAKEQGVEIATITEKYAKIYNKDLAALNCLRPTHQPKATDNIGGMIAMIDKLLEDGFAYASDGHVFFDVSKYDEYGKLSGNTLDALRKGDRVGEGEVARKKNAADFVLWKPPLDGVSWAAPFGEGRPGWHIECSAMAKEVLGETIDIHCGGVDLKFPHHENEIAQSECAHGKPMARYWVHNNFLNMGTEKMSKSIGNIKLISELLEDWDGEVIRLALLKAHYRSELIWTEGLLKESYEQLEGWYRTLEKVGAITGYSKEEPHMDALASLLNDLNTSNCISEIGNRFGNARVDVGALKSLESRPDHPSRENLIHGTRVEINKALSEALAAAKLLGLLQQDPEDWFKGDTSDDEESRIEALIQERLDARANKDWARGDEIRDQLAAEGIVLEDGQGVTTWRRE
ncbi:MAG: cysteine--tRNA ligase [Acidimicrobiales bacterium]|nr:cysteine--tRNA ligase [Hyphomonadaceae bacterium]RZV39539.1 MAG: cysteine--tRNA ligase [Acidimicrobiales bacterium]